MSQEQGPDDGVRGPDPAPAASWSAPDAAGDRRSASDGDIRLRAPARTAESSVDLLQPDRIPLRPLGVGDLLDGTFTTIRRNPKATLGLAAVLVTLQQAVAVAIDLATNGLPTLGGFSDEALSLQALGGFGGIAGTLLAAVVGAVLTGMLVIVVSDDVVGRRATAAEVWRRIRPRLWALLVAAAVAGIVPYVGLLFFLVPGLILWASWALTTPALVLEGLGPFAALARSWQLAWPSLLRVWWVRTLSVLLGSLIQLLIAVPFGVAGAVIVFLAGDGNDGSSTAAVAVLAVTMLGAIAAGTVTAPFLAGVLALLYVDRRMRAEGLDLALRRQDRRAGRGPRSAAASPPVPDGAP